MQVEGCRWFHDTLVDADLAINSMMWQNAGKAGLDQWNFTLLPTSRSQASASNPVSVEMIGSWHSHKRLTDIQSHQDPAARRQCI